MAEHKSITIKNAPRHIALIPDGNRRWARKRGLAPWMGHWHGLRALNRIVKLGLDYSIPYMSFWGASIDNVTKRGKTEVDFLMKIFKSEFEKLARDKTIQKRGVRINAVGDWQIHFPKETAQAIQSAIDATAKNNKFYCNFFLGYSGTKEITDCVKSIAQKAKAGEKLEINGEAIKANLYTKHLPPVDLLIRTGGEPHNSDGFMMWDTANAQYVFFKKYWPDFSEKDFIKAIKEYARRERRMGG